MERAEVEKLIEQMRPRIRLQVGDYLKINRHVGSHAEDLEQEVLIAIYRKATAAKSIEDFRWSSLDAINVCSKYAHKLVGITRTRKEPFQCTSMNLVAEQPDPNLVCDGGMDSVFATIMTTQFFRILDPVSRWVLYRQMAGWTQTEIAKDISVSIPRVNAIIQKMRGQYKAFA